MSEIQRDPETEAFIDTLENNDIFRFMRSEYDRATNDGDSYDAELHDPMVAVIASASGKFDITKERAGDIYAETEVAIARFWEKRKNSVL